jgi:hypothetical protein
MLLGGPAVFCDQFNTPNPGIASRTGGLDPRVWGVSRIGGATNWGQGQINDWGPTALVTQSGTQTVSPPNDVIVQNGQLREATNDLGGVTALAMYMKQPFDFTGRTGTISFDVSNDTQGGHAAWPEIWITDLPVPAPFVHFTTLPCDLCSMAQNSVGVRMAARSWAGNPGICPQPTGDVDRFAVDDLVITRNYALEEHNFQDPVVEQIFYCPTLGSPNGAGSLNHIEVRVAQNQIEFWGTDAGVTPSASTLKLLTRFSNINLPLSRGLVWLMDAHYNAHKGACDGPEGGRPGSGIPCQSMNTFVWDNVAFDGPFTYRDFSYDALDDGTPSSNGSTRLAKVSAVGQPTSWNVLNMPANPQAAAVRVLFNYLSGSFIQPQNFTLIVNGHDHGPIPSPFTTQQDWNWKTHAVTIPISDLQAGTNVVQIGSPDQPIQVGNVNIVLVNVPGGVPVLPGSNNAYPAGGP